MFRRVIWTTATLLLFSCAADAKTETKIYAVPQLDGQRVDACLKKGGACGQSAATKFCREVGYQSARKFSSQPTSSQTVYPGSGAACTSGCKALVDVACMRESKKTLSVISTTETSVGEVQD